GEVRKPRPCARRFPSLPGLTDRASRDARALPPAPAQHLATAVPDRQPLNEQRPLTETGRVVDDIPTALERGGAGGGRREGPRGREGLRQRTHLVRGSSGDRRGARMELPQDEGVYRF